MLELNVKVSSILAIGYLRTFRLELTFSQSTPSISAYFVFPPSTVKAAMLLPPRPGNWMSWMFALNLISVKLDSVKVPEARAVIV